MKTNMHIGLILKVDIGTTAYNSIVDTYPDGDKGNYFKAVFPEGDERLHKVIEQLRQFGFCPNEMRNKPKPTEYKLWKERIYEADDFNNVSLVEPWPSISFETIFKRTADGLLAISSDIESSSQIGRVDSNAMAVSKCLKAFMENASFKHLIYV